MPNPSKVFMKCSSCNDFWLLPVGQQVCDRCLLHQERERAEQYASILREIVEAQDEIDIEAEKPLHQRVTRPIIKKQRAIEEARRLVGDEEEDN
jgi:hypothetical protein